MFSMEAASTGLSANPTGGGTWDAECDYDTAGAIKSNGEIWSQAIASTATVDPAYDWTNGSASFHSSVYCAEISPPTMIRIV